MLLDIYIPGSYVTGHLHSRYLCYWTFIFQVPMLLGIHTQKNEHFTYGFVLGPLQFQSIGQNSHLTSKQQVGCVGFHWHSPHCNKPNWPCFRKFTTNLDVLLPLTSRQGSYDHKTYSLSFFLLCQVTQIPASTLSNTRALFTHIVS